MMLCIFLKNCWQWNIMNLTQCGTFAYLYASPFFRHQIFDRIESSRVTNLLPTTLFLCTKKSAFCPKSWWQSMWYEIFFPLIFSCFYVVDIINSHMWLESLVFIVTNWVITFCVFFLHSHILILLSTCLHQLSHSP